MRRGKIGVMGIAVLAILGAAGLSQAAPATLSQVVYITRSKAWRGPVKIRFTNASASWKLLALQPQALLLVI